MSAAAARFTAAADASIAARAAGAPRAEQDAAGRAVIEALDALHAERAGRPEPADVVAAAHLALDAALGAARIRGARVARASSIPAGGPDPGALAGLASAAVRSAERSAQAAHDAIDLLAVALGARS